MWKLIVNIILCLIYFNSIAQRIVTETGSAQTELPDYKSRKQVEHEAEELAIVDALEKAFGRVIVQGNSTFIQNINTGEKTETNSVFNMIANSTVKGEVMEIVNKDFSEIEGYKVIGNKKEKIIYLKCDIKVKAREIVVQFPLLPL